MYLQTLAIENIRALKKLRMTFPTHPAGWHVIIGDNGSGKSTLIRAISLGLIGPNEVRAAHPNFSEWLRKDAKRGSVELVMDGDKDHDFTKGLGRSHKLTSKVLIQSSHSLSGLLGSPALVEAVADDRVKPSPDKFLWSSATKGWFSAGFGPFRRFTGGDAELDKVYSSSPLCGAHLSVFGEDVALTEALSWLKELDYKQLKNRERKAQKDASTLSLTDDNQPNNTPDEVKQLWEIADRLQKSSLFTEAESLLRRALVLAEKANGPEHSSVIFALLNLSALLRDTNQLAEAELLARRALDISEANYEPEDHNVGGSINSLALLLRLTNRLTEAEPLMHRALAIAEANHGPEHPDVGASLNNLAMLFHETNRLTEAEPLMRRALAIAEANHGPEHPDVATRLNNLGYLLVETNQLEEAEILLRRALAIDEANYGPEHPNVATRLSNLGQLLEDTNRVEEAEALLRRALAIGEASYGPEHPTVAIRLNNLGSLLHDTNRVEEAESLLRRALTISETSYGPEHPSVATRLNNLALLLKDTNRIVEAESLLRRALAIDETSYGPLHPRVANSLGNLGYLLKGTERLAEAENFFKQALAINEESYGSLHPKVANDLTNLGALSFETSKYKEAEAFLRRALAINEANYDSNHPKVVSNYNQIIAILKDNNREKEANELYINYIAKQNKVSKSSSNIKAINIPPKLPLDENDWLPLRLRTFINESKILPPGTEFKGMSAEGPIFRDGNGHILTVTQLSDGFRSILSLAFELIRQLIKAYGLIAVFPPNGNHIVINLPGVVLIDEVDTHLHPTWQARIGQWFTKSFPKMQFIVTTHSPLICRAVTETTGSIWRLPTPGQGNEFEEVKGIERQRLRLGSVLDAYGTGLFGGEEVEQSLEAMELLDELARINAKDAVGKATQAEQKRLRELKQMFPSSNVEIEL